MTEHSEKSCCHAAGAQHGSKHVHEDSHQEHSGLRDPVCGMSVDVAGARHRTTYQGRTWYVCSAGCLASFELEPTRFQEVGS